MLTFWFTVTRSQPTPSHGDPGPSTQQQRVLEDLQQAENYRDWFVELASPWLGEEALEVGAGRGDHAAAWAREGRRMTVAESDPDRLADLRRRFKGTDVEVISLTLPERPVGTYSAIVAFNVLEHIEDDEAAIGTLSRALLPGGHLVIVVPAFEFAMSRFDRAIGHFRRYRTARLRDLVERHGLEVVELRYLNPIGLVGWLVLMRLLGRVPSGGRMLQVFDRFIVPLQRRLEASWSPPFGQSAFLVARHP